MAEVDPRVNGTEMEWAVMAEDDSNNNKSVMVGSGALTEHFKAYSRQVRGHDGMPFHYLENGARMYVDVGDHLEYATPETTKFTEAVAAEIAGERVVRECLATTLPERLTGFNYKNYRLHKRVADRSGNTSGHHENYQASAAEVPIDPDKLQMVAAHVVTRQVLFGAGFLSQDGKFMLSQKATSVETDFSTGTTRQKPIIVLRDESLAGKEWSRVQVVGGDPNMSPWAMRLKLATTRIVVRMQEYGINVPGVDLMSPVQAMHHINRTLGQDKFELSDGTMTDAVSVQRQFIEAGQKLAAEGLLEDQEMDALDEWNKAIADFSQNPELLYDRADWVLRRKMLLAQHEKHGYAWDSIAMRNIDLTWDVIGSGGTDEKHHQNIGIGEKLRQGIWAKYMPDKVLIQRFKRHAPESTRAHARSRFLQAFGAPNNTLTVGWDRVSIGDDSVKLNDPREPYNQELETMIETHPKSRLAA